MAILIAAIGCFFIVDGVDRPIMASELPWGILCLILAALLAILDVLLAMYKHGAGR